MQRFNGRFAYCFILGCRFLGFGNFRSFYLGASFLGRFCLGGSGSLSGYLFIASCQANFGWYVVCAWGWRSRPLPYTINQSPGRPFFGILVRLGFTGRTAIGF